MHHHVDGHGSCWRQKELTDCSAVDDSCDRHTMLWRELGVGFDGSCCVASGTVELPVMEGFRLSCFSIFCGLFLRTSGIMFRYVVTLFNIGRFQILLLKKCYNFQNKINSCGVFCYTLIRSYYPKSTSHVLCLIEAPHSKPPCRP